jgi:ATP-dependent helicase/nuclease subunit A
LGGTQFGSPAEELVRAREAAKLYQRNAADPANSAWVSANAGTGKTYVLVLRVLRLLLAGAPADSILCLTFTKAAAAEMSNRLIARLGTWAAMSDAALRAELADTLQRAPTDEESAFARCLFARVLDAPGGLKIMTIHAFCDRVLRRFPLEAGVPPSFTILTDEDRHALLSDAMDAVLHEAAKHARTHLGRALPVVVAYAGEDRFQELLQAVIAKKEALRELVRSHEGSDIFGAVEASLRSALGVGRRDTLASILAEQAETAPDTLIARAVIMLREGKTTDNVIADGLAAAQGKPDELRVKLLAKTFLTEKGEARADSRFITKALRAEYPGLAEEICRARDDFAALDVKRRALEAAIASAALLRLADAVIQRYEDAKAQRTAMDFDGLIAKTASLFQRSDAAAWVLYRLDADLTHILVDEAQDTSPAQWALVRALTTEFFAGEGVEDRPRTLFAVGDEKQSIYSFQGADPRQFAETGRDYAARAKTARQPWLEAPLALSFRSTRAVLEAVDHVFSNRERTPGLTADGGPVRHYAHREGEAGLVELWPPIKAEAPESAPAWEPFSEAAGAAPPAMELASRIARQIRHWLDSGERLASLGRPIRAGDILILVRKRAPFAAPMVRALKSLGIPVAGADRMRLTEQLAVMDLIALGDVCLLPEDDLTLATLLKSPAFGLDDDDLFVIGHGRDGSLWSALHEKAPLKPAYADAVRRLEAWRTAAVREKPFDFYMARLEGDGLRAKLLARLGPDAADAVDELLNLALTYEAAETPTLQGFLHWLRVADAEVKRDMEAGRDEVRVMTVHGSKGLEANIVFLADTCSAKSASRRAILELRERPGAPPLLLWVTPGSQLVPVIRAACDADQAAEREEYQRLLYVAMTRARDRLYVAGFEGQRKRDGGCWYDLVSDGLGGRLTAAEDFAGGPVMRMEYTQVAPPKPSPAAREERTAAALPHWHGLPPAAAQAPILVNPSRLDLGAGKGSSLLARPRGEALLRGQLVHRLLEMLPLLPEPTWQKRGAAFLAAEGGSLPLAEREALLASICEILRHPGFAGVFGPGSQAEVPVTASLTAAPGGEAPILISGQIDRLVQRGGEVLILDYKSSAVIPQAIENTPENYLAQLAAYRLALSRILPATPIRAALLWTEAPLLTPIPDAMLDRGEWLLYESVRSAHLDRERRRA